MALCEHGRSCRCGPWRPISHVGAQQHCFAAIVQVQEAMLTGESVPISKNLIPVAENAGLGDRKCMAFSATTVSAGQGLGVVVATGGRSAVITLKELRFSGSQYYQKASILLHISA